MVGEPFFCQISRNSNDWIVRNWQVSAKAIGLNFSSNFTCAAFNWVLSILKNPKIAGFFASLPFLTYLCYKRLKPSTYWIQLRRQIVKIEWALSKKNDRCIKGKFVFAILVHVLNCISKSACENCVWPPSQAKRGPYYRVVVWVLYNQFKCQIYLPIRLWAWDFYHMIVDEGTA